MPQVDVTIKGHDQLSPTMRECRGSVTDFNQALEVAGKVARTVGQIYEATVGKYLEYADNVDNLSSITGQTSEATSRFITVLGDFGIEMSQITAAGRAMRDDGLAPTLDTLAALSDQYLALAPGMDRINFLQDKLGRQGAEYVDVLDQGSEAILERSRLVADGNVLSAEDLRLADEMQLAQAGLNDSWTSLCRTIGVAVIPVLTAAAGTLNLLLTAEQQTISVLEEHAGEMRDSTVSYQDYNAELRRAAEVAGLSVNAEGDLIRIIHGRTGATQELIQANYLLSESSLETARTGRDAAGGWDEGTRAALGLGAAINGLPTVHTINVGVHTQLDSIAAAILQRWGLGAFATFLMRGGQVSIGGTVYGAGAVVGMSSEELSGMGQSFSSTGPGTVAGAMAWRAQAGVPAMTVEQLVAAGYRREGGGPLFPITEVGEEGTEGIINGMVVPHDLWERLKRMGLQVDQQAMTVGEGGTGVYVAPKPPAPKGTSKKGAVSGGGYISGGGGEVAGGGGVLVADIVEEVQQASAQESAALVASIPAAAASAASEQGRQQVAEARNIGNDTIVVLRRIEREIAKLNQTFPTVVRDAVERVM